MVAYTFTRFHTTRFYEDIFKVKLVLNGQIKSYLPHYKHSLPQSRITSLYKKIAKSWIKKRQAQERRSFLVNFLPHERKNLRHSVILARKGARNHWLFSLSRPSDMDVTVYR